MALTDTFVKTAKPSGTPTLGISTRIPALSVNGKRFSSEADAQQAVDAQNTPEAKSQRFAAALERSGTRQF